MKDPSAGTVAFFTTDHRECDALWAEFERVAEAGDKVRTAALWAQFEGVMERHFSMEEEVLFPAFEQATGMTMGPTAVMRQEHKKMRAVLGAMGELAAAGDFEGVLDQGDTLHLLVQQHNAKEEGMLYPMAEGVLSASWEEITERLRSHLK